MCMRRPKYICYTNMDGQRMVMPHDVYTDQLRIGEYKQVEFDYKELNAMDAGIKVKNKSCALPTDVKKLNTVISAQNVFVAPGFGYNPYANYTPDQLEFDDSDLNSDEEEFNDEKVQYIDQGILPHPVTIPRSQSESLSTLAKILVVLTVLMLISVIQHFIKLLYPSIFLNSYYATGKELIPEIKTTYQHMTALDELYNNYNL